MRLPAFNRANVSPRELASIRFNERPVPLVLQGVNGSHGRFFQRLAEINSLEERSHYFQGYMDVVFRLHQWEAAPTRADRVSLKNSYLRFLMGWMVDANSPEGAVLKGWVESRLGLPPLFHGGPLEEADSEAQWRYALDRARGFGRTNAILHQLDLLYAYVQAELARGWPNRTHLTLYRGVYDLREHRLLEDYGNGRWQLWLNNLNSFTHDFERAWEFGDRVLEVQVPLPKIFFDGALLHSAVLRGEEEVMVIGGRYDVRVRWY